MGLKLLIGLFSVRLWLEACEASCLMDGKRIHVAAHRLSSRFSCFGSHDNPNSAIESNCSGSLQCELTVYDGVHISRTQQCGNS